MLQDPPLCMRGAGASSGAQVQTTASTLSYSHNQQSRSIIVISIIIVGADKHSLKQEVLQDTMRQSIPTTTRSHAAGRLRMHTQSQRSVYEMNHCRRSQTGCEHNLQRVKVTRNG